MLKVLFLYKISVSQLKIFNNYSLQIKVKYLVTLLLLCCSSFYTKHHFNRCFISVHCYILQDRNMNGALTVIVSPIRAFALFTKLRVKQALG
jgi:hypothetical protein